jgi:hypothetical protein
MLNMQLQVQLLQAYMQHSSKLILLKRLQTGSSTGPPQLKRSGLTGDWMLSVLAGLSS